MEFIEEIRERGFLVLEVELGEADVSDAFVIFAELAAEFFSGDFSDASSTSTVVVSAAESSTALAQEVS